MLQYLDNDKIACVDGIRFTRDEHTGYYLSSRCINGHRKRLHVYIWEKTNGSVPKGFDIHHKDGNKKNNDISNLTLLSRSEHKTLHCSMMTEEQRESSKKRMMKLMPLAKAWHSSSEGLQWHKIHGSIVMNNRLNATHICENCGKEFVSKRIYKSTEHKYCCNNCKSAYRRKSGVDNEIRKCQYCGKEYLANKYSGAKYCSAECKYSARRDKVHSQDSAGASV